MKNSAKKLLAVLLLVLMVFLSSCACDCDRTGPEIYQDQEKKEEDCGC